MSTKMSGKTSSFLEIDDNILKKQLLLEGDEQKELDKLFPETSTQRAAIIKPKPGICVKTKDNKKNKIFINVCTSDAIPSPENISEQELISILESEEPSDFKVPMSIGQPHNELDKSGESCVAYDVVISPEFFDKMSNNPLFNNFFMIATLEGIEEKYNLKLDKNGWTFLKNKKYHGTMPEQAVRTTVPLVQELSGVRHWKTADIPGSTTEPSSGSLSSSQPLIIEVSTKKVEKTMPKYNMEKVPSKSDEKLLLARIELPDMVSGSDIGVNIGEDRIVVESQKTLFDVFVPFPLNNGRADAHFITFSKVLLLRIPIISA